MTDDQTRAYETPLPDGPGTPGDPVTATGAGAAPASDGAATTDAAPPAAPAATTTVQSTSSGPSRTRLLAGLGVAGVVLALAAGGVLLLGGSSTPEALRYIPGDAAAVVELRMDLPGDQMQKLGNLLSRFPGFADQSTLPAKIDEAFSQLVRNASDGEADYATDVKPWLNGPFFAAADAGSMAEPSGEGTGRFVAAATTNGAVACTSTFEGRPTTTEAYQGVQLTLTTEAPSMACAIDGRFAVIGDPASVRKALDTKAAGSGMDKSATYTAARKRLAGEQLATVWFSGAALRDAAPSPDPALPMPAVGPFAGAIPEWFILGVRAEDDAAVVELVSAPIPASTAGPSLLSMPPGHPSALVGLVPADTLVYAEGQGMGVGLTNLLTTLRSVPELQEQLAVIDGMARPEELVGWVEDAALAVSAEGSSLEDVNPQVTVLLAAKDATTATEKVTTLRTLLSFLGMAGEGVTVTDAQIGGVTATTVTITDLGAIVPPGSIPDVPVLPSGELSFSVAAKDRIVYLTIGKGTIEKVLGLAAGGSLADSAAFKQASARGLPNSQATMYVAAGAAVDFVEPFLPAEVAAQWTSDIKPYVDPIEAFASWTTSDASGLHFRNVITVTQP